MGDVLTQAVNGYGDFQGTMTFDWSSDIGETRLCKKAGLDQTRFYLLATSFTVPQFKDQQFTMSLFGVDKEHVGNLSFEAVQAFLRGYHSDKPAPVTRFDINLDAQEFFQYFQRFHFVARRNGFEVDGVPLEVVNSYRQD